MRMVQRASRAVGVTNKLQQLLFAGLLHEARDEAGDPKPEPKPKREAKVTQLPIWAEPQRATPNVLLRSSLFCC